jgi:hypothetical protein
MQRVTKVNGVPVSNGEAQRAIQASDADKPMVRDAHLWIAPCGVDCAVQRVWLVRSDRVLH